MSLEHLELPELLIFWMQKMFVFFFMMGFLPNMLEVVGVLAILYMLLFKEAGNFGLAGMSI